MFKKIVQRIRSWFMHATVNGAQLNVWATENRLPVALTLVGMFLVLVLFYGVLIRPPSDFPYDKVVRIKEGNTLSSTAAILESRGVIRSPFLFKITAIAFKGEGSVIAGDYFFQRDKNVFSVANMITTGDYGLVPVKVTIPEGSSAKDIALILTRKFTVFDPTHFLALGLAKEGYLFPDTYYFLPNVDEESVIDILEKTFYYKLETLQDKIDAFGKPLDEVITMASIIEREARTPESRRIISGILWRRIEMGMPLQVDVTFDYINGKNTYALTLKDLAIDDPYNTYRYEGLPPGPIANPSLDSIEAAVTPTESDYLFFLADRRGTVHYSETFEQHRQKKAMYVN